ncbi:hypothetical protein C4D60_Mb04t34110 [Musa balbisiana]|uniref:Uncharacterized protein n=1 Tax=Musa balbisiana TaxID=52838 RepID=A0A4S8KH84_MUSBA|nr:hypothetical protein C4D60_Mb04t34110 [Musa balbisiana]
MCTLGILNAFVVTLRLLSPTAILHSLLSIKVYRSIIESNKPLITTLVDLLGASDVSTRSIKDILKAHFGLIVYPLNYTALVELGIMLPLFTLVVKDKRKGVVEDTTTTITHVAGCDESVEVF